MTYETSLSKLPESISEFVEFIATIDFVTKTKYQSENGIDTTPAIITIQVVDGTSDEEIERLAVITKTIVEKLVTVDVKASIEHPLEAVMNEDGELTDLTPNEDIDTISVRWNSQMATTPDDVRYEGYAITDAMIEEYQDGNNLPIPSQ